MTSLKNISKKIGRNDPCSCGSGTKYKYCCAGAARQRVIRLDQNCECGNKLEIDIIKHPESLLANLEIPIKNFCRDHQFYFFSSVLTVGEVVKVSEMLRAETLSISYLLELYKTKLTRERVLGLLENAEGLHPAFASRATHIRDAVEAHFNGKYSLSVPALFPHIEGFHRQYGGLTLRQDFVPTLPKEIWNMRFLPSLNDSVEFFNAYLSNIFKGNQPADAFNRNPILHGMSPSHASEEWSLILLLIILEIRTILWFEKNTHPLIKSEAVRN